MDTSKVKESETEVEKSVWTFISDPKMPSFMAEIKEFDTLVISEEASQIATAPSKEAMHEDRYSLPLLLVDEGVKRIIEPYIQTETIITHLRKRVTEKRRRSIITSEKKAVVSKDISTSLSDKAELAKVLQEHCDILKNVTNSQGVRLYMVDEANEELVLHTQGIQPRHKINFKIGPLGIVAAHVAFTKEYIVTDDILGDRRFPEGVPWRGPLVKHVLCVPILTPDDQCIAIIELFKDMYETLYLEKDVQLVLSLVWWMGAAIYQDARRLVYRKAQTANQYLFATITSDIAKDGHIEKVIQEIMAFAKVTIEAQRGLFYLVDDEENPVLANVFCNEDEIDNEDMRTSYEKAQKVTYLVIHTRKGMNILDATTHPFLDDVDEAKATFITRSILCMPITDENRIVGVIQLLNKRNGGSFTKDDVNIFQNCAAYATLQLKVVELEEKLKITDLKNAVKTEMIANHIKASEEEIRNLMLLQKDIQIPSYFNTFTWYMFGYERQLAELTLYMLRTIDPNNFIDSETACSFVLSIMKVYRDNPYHNYHHAFSVCHCMWNILRRHKDVFSLTEKRALMVATLGHDIDHYGFTNYFMRISNNSLYQLYPESTMEHHHVEVLTFIMNLTNLYKNLPDEEYKEIAQEMAEMIIATDPVEYFTSRSKIIAITSETKFDTSDPSHRKLLKKLMMSACDLCGQCKPYAVSSRITEDLYREFYHEGDLLKSMGITPPSVMDRDKSSMIPEDQYKYLEVIVIPCMDLLWGFLPGCEDLHTTCKLISEQYVDYS